MDLTVPNALSDICLECNDATLYFSKFTLAYRFGYFRTMFTGSIPFIGDTVHLDYSKNTVLALLNNCVKLTETDNPEKYQEILLAASYLDVKPLWKIEVPTEVLTTIIEHVFPACAVYIETKSLKSYVNSMRFDVTRTSFEIFEFVDDYTFMNIIDAYFQIKYDPNRMIAICLARFRELPRTTRKKMYGELILKFLDLPDDRFHTFCRNINAALK